ncbi:MULTISPECIES: phytanoyl-CoA dioxygenase family protein [unclassified Streptomyces]|uniref:phytanoyl-CoA dioxygenase family protein n=1 Tax=unclassified Streptomyces TaxID=2593676 RepID=UPI000DAC64F9|nr:MULTISPECIES: phytanoyl-CoA dioxygenase family protein [unclassified Streptomyces]PZT72160.1 phytanoyl-CoA dioxygenase [Streptomyces sp. AC1-42T]PZT81519.1 phytanoyl-CoA dioxygenase [Streptomyces sp. AC1-42W]
MEDCRTYLQTVSAVGGALARYAAFPKIHLVSMWADRIVHHPAIVDAVESLLGPELLVWSTNLFIRPAHSGSSLAWHQDAVYLGLDGLQRHAVRVWVALTDTTVANGTMRYARGSHLRGPLPHRFSGSGLEDIMRGEEIAVEIDEANAVDVVLEAGQCSLHHLAMAHCSGPNHTDSGRFNLAIDYITPQVAPTAGEDSALLVRGGNTGAFLPEARPVSDFDGAALRQFYAAAARRQKRIDETISNRGTTRDQDRT